MSEEESFLARWSRLKAELAERPEAASSEAGRDERETSLAAPPAATEQAEVAFDQASLPPIESISADADIRPFLQSGVPAELTRAALRRAWATDPAIRDFIGIAENQWDFNDPTAMPGFGPLAAGDLAATLAAQALGGASDRVTRIAEASISAALPKPEAVDRPPERPSHSVNGPADAETVGLGEKRSEGNIAGGDDGGAAELSGAPRVRRSHGGALPR